MKKMFRVRDREEILRIHEQSPVYWNDGDMRRYCGYTLEFEGPIKDVIHGKHCVYWKYFDRESSHSWIFPPEWLEDLILPEELFEI